MPNRIIREGFLTSERVNTLSVEAETFFLRLMLKADDYGRFSADLRILKAGLYPLKLDVVREPDISRWLTECQAIGLVSVYEKDLKRFLEITDFNQQIRAKASKYPSRETAVEVLVRSICIADAQHLRTKSESESESESESKSEARAESVRTHEIETPSLDEVKLYAARIGLAEWRAVDEWQKLEAVHWHLGTTKISSWRYHFNRVRTWWETDGRPMAPRGNQAKPQNTPTPKKGGKF